MKQESFQDSLLQQTHIDVVVEFLAVNQAPALGHRDGVRPLRRQVFALDSIQPASKGDARGNATFGLGCGRSVTSSSLALEHCGVEDRPQVD